MNALLVRSHLARRPPPQRCAWFLVPGCVLFGTVLLSCACDAFDDPPDTACDPPGLLLAYHDDPCRQAYGGKASRNAGYYSQDYFCRIISDHRDYSVVIGLDSTIALAARYPGFIDQSSTQMVALYDNTTCDMIEQLPNVLSKDPRAVIYSTNGGNDLRAGIAPAQVIVTFERLIQLTRQRWPSARIVVIGIHPSLFATINSHKGQVNRAIEGYLATLPNTCYIDPLALFGVDEGEPAPPILLRDPLHYKMDVSKAIKQTVHDKCGVSF